MKGVLMIAAEIGQEKSRLGNTFYDFKNTCTSEYLDTIPNAFYPDLPTLSS